MAFQDRAHVGGILEAAGLEDIRIEITQVDLTPSGSLAGIAEFAARVGPAARAVREHEAGQREVSAIETCIVDALKPCESSLGVRVPATLNLCSARRRG